MFDHHQPTERHPLLAENHLSKRIKHHTADLLNSSVEDLDDQVSIAALREHDLSLIDSIKYYPYAVGWASFFALGIIWCAFDAQLMVNLYAVPAFQRDFGVYYKDTYIIPAAWQTGLSMGGPFGAAVGGFSAAYPMEWYGRKKTFGGCVIVTSAIIAIQYFARSLPVLLVGELLGGLVLGTFAVIAPVFASEVCPTALRGSVTAATNICFVTGQLLANCVVAYTQRMDSHWAYSVPFALQWFWPAILLPILPFAPESPWWLIRNGDVDEAERSLRRLASSEIDIKPSLAMMAETDRLEREIEAGSTYLDCFNVFNSRRTQIAIGVYCIQVLAGNYLGGYATYFFELAGLPATQAFNMSIVYLSLGFVGTCVSWVLLIFFGRRRIYITGLALLATLMLLVGVLDCLPSYKTNPTIVWVQAMVLIFWNFVYGCSVGPVCFVIVCEVSATRLRSKTIGVSSALQASLGAVMTILVPFMISPAQANLRGKSGFVFAATGALSFIWAFTSLPETGGRTYEELDVMFEQHVKTRDFRTYVVD